MLLQTKTKRGVLGTTLNCIKQQMFNYREQFGTSVTSEASVRTDTTACE